MDTRKCENCGAACGPDDVFCESCGYDFITGSLPSDAPATSPVGPGSSGAGGADQSEAPADADDETAELDQVSPPPPSLLDPDGGGSAELTRLRLVIAVDRAYFDEVVSDGEIDFPDPVPNEAELELVGDELHIGRTSESRAIHPDIDVAELTGDQAVSSRHAVFRLDENGGYTITDVGSTNGTFLDAVDSEAIAEGVAIEVKPGTPIYLGAWTRITILD